MKSILQSIKPQYCELIASGKKTIEVRKTRPKLDVPFKVYIYCTKGGEELFREDWLYDEKVNGKVIGEYVCDEIKELRFDAFEQCYFMRARHGESWLSREFLEGTCLSYKEAYEYCKNLKCDSEHTDMFYGWHILDLKIYDKPKELSEFGNECNLDCPSVHCPYWKYQRVNADEWDYDCTCNNIRPLTRPPQSWCYVEEVGA